MTMATSDELLRSIVDQLYSPAEDDNNQVAARRDLFDRILARCTDIKGEFLSHFAEEVFISKKNGGARFAKLSGTASQRTVRELRKVEKACMRAAEALSMVTDNMAWLPEGKLEIKAGQNRILMGAAQLSRLLVNTSKLAKIGAGEVPRPKGQSIPHKDFSALYAYTLFGEFSDHIPNGVTDGRYSIVARLLYEFLTGITENLDRSCDKVLKETRSKRRNPVAVASVIKPSII
jgi:hypothetical protein